MLATSHLVTDSCLQRCSHIAHSSPQDSPLSYCFGDPETTSRLKDLATPGFVQWRQLHIKATDWIFMKILQRWTRKSPLNFEPEFLNGVLTIVGPSHTPQHWVYFIQHLFIGNRNMKLNGSVKEPNISIYSFFRPSLNGVLFPMICLLVEGECHILVFQNIIS